MPFFFSFFFLLRPLQGHGEESTLSSDVRTPVCVLWDTVGTSSTEVKGLGSQRDGTR